MNKQYAFFKKLFPALLAVVVLNISCKKYIYQAPITSTYGSEFWTSETSVNQACNAMYGQLRSSLRQDDSYFINGDLTAGVFQVLYAIQWNLSPVGVNNPYSGGPYNFSYVPYLEGSLQNWSRFYRVIAQANLILENLPKMSNSLFKNGEADKNAFLAQALFMKAYTYFYMVRIWGDPVYVSKTFDDVDYGKIPPVARTPEVIVLDSCIANLKIASGYLDYKGGDPTAAVTPNKGSVYALLAHIYEWKHDYANAHAACQEVINNGGYSLEPMDTYKNIWKGESSNESIFELSMQYDPNDPNFNQNDWAEAQFDFFGVFLKGSIVDNVKSSCWIANAGGIADVLFDTANDQRAKQILTLVNASGGSPKGYMLLKYTNFMYQNADNKSGAYINNNLVLFRLSDIILLDAEALASTGDLEGARKDLAMTEDRAGIASYNNPANQYDMLDEVVMERGRELIGEGQWYYDLVRTEQTQQWLEYVGYQSTRVTPDQKGYYWPLDMGTLFPQDNLLTQNPYWATHK